MPTPSKPLPQPQPLPLPLPLLYSFRRCPYAIRARMALRCAGIAVTEHEVALRQKPAALLVLSPKGTVPVLQLPSGELIDQSLDIMRWALRQSDPQDWLGTGDAAAGQRWIDLNDGVFKALLDRYKYPQRHPEHTALEHRTQALAQFITPLDACLRDRACVLAAQPALADVAIFPFVRQFAMVDSAWFDSAPLPGLQRWLQVWLQTELFARVMDKHSAAAPAAVRSVLTK